MYQIEYEQDNIRSEQPIEAVLHQADRVTAEHKENQSHQRIVEAIEKGEQQQNVAEQTISRGVSIVREPATFTADGRLTRGKVIHKRKN